MLDGEDIIGRWVAQGGAFVWFREPGQRVCRGIRASLSSLESFPDIPSLDGKTGFVFAPFRIGEGHPLWLLPFGEEVSVRMPAASEAGETEAPVPVEFGGRLERSPSVDYGCVFREFSTALRQGAFRKLVLSRRSTEALPGDFSWARAIYAACRRYVRSYVYLFHTPHTGFWLGATPEILLAGGEGAYRTMALAGTQALCHGEPEGPWSEKNIREQAFVTEYINERLKLRGLVPEAEGPYTVTAGELAHLRTDIRFALSSSDRIGSLLQDLHPTPAVCGLPAPEAFRFIGRHEGYDRSYYAGFLGCLSPAGHTALYVNLRCMQGIGAQGIRLYAGGGLLPASVCEEEWLETERKMQTMKYVISKGLRHVF